MVARIDKVFPTPVADGNHVPHHGTGNVRKTVIGAVNNFKMCKNIFKPLRIISAAGKINVRFFQVGKGFFQKIKHEFSPFRRIVYVKQTDNPQPFAFGFGIEHVFYHLLAFRIAERIACRSLFLNRTENNRDLAAFCQHVADNFFMADMQRLRPHDCQSVPVLMIFRHFSLLKTALKYGRKVAKLQIQNILTHALCPPKLKKNFLVR